MALPPPEYAVFIFQTLGYVETQDGKIRAIVADGPRVYLVERGELFAGQYRATSVDTTVVLAERAPAGSDAGNLVFAQAEPLSKPASNEPYRSLRFALSDLTGVQALNVLGASGSQVLMDLGVDLLNSSLTGFDALAYFRKAGNPSTVF